MQQRTYKSNTLLGFDDTSAPELVSSLCTSRHRLAEMQVSRSPRTVSQIPHKLLNKQYHKLQVKETMYQVDWLRPAILTQQVTTYDAWLFGT